MLMKHPYFKEIDFKDLLFQDVPLKLPEKIYQEFQLIDNLIPTKGRDNIVREGILLKRNEWYWKQERHFVLHANGDLKYYKNGN